MSVYVYVYIDNIYIYVCVGMHMWIRNLDYRPRGFNYPIVMVIKNRCNMQEMNKMESGS